MAPGIVADDAAPEPDDFLGAEVVAQDLFGERTTELRVPRGLAVEQALLGGEQRSLAVDVDRAAFQHDVAVLFSERDDGLEHAASRATRRP